MRDLDDRVHRVGPCAGQAETNRPADRPLTAPKATSSSDSSSVSSSRAVDVRRPSVANTASRSAERRMSDIVAGEAFHHASSIAVGWSGDGARSGAAKSIRSSRTRRCTSSSAFPGDSVDRIAGRARYCFRQRIAQTAATEGQVRVEGRMSPRSRRRIMPALRRPRHDPEPVTLQQSVECHSDPRSLVAPPWTRCPMRAPQGA